MKSAIVLIALCLLGFTAFAQEKEGKDLWRKYDKYRDITLIGTDATDVLAKTGGMHTAAAMIVGVLIPNDGKPITEVAMAFYPDTVSVLGGLQRSIAAQKDDLKFGNDNAPATGKVYFRPFAEAVLLIGQERFKLAPADKAFGLSGSGRFKDEVIVMLPLKVFNQLASSPQWSILIGDVVVGIGDPDLSDQKKRPGHYIKRVQPRLLALRDRINQLNTK